MKHYVLDTSVIVKWFSEEKGSEKAGAILQQLQNQKVEILMPELVKYELANAFLKGKKLAGREAEVALETFYNLPLLFTAETPESAKLTYVLAEKLNISYYDACFLALAKIQKATLITANPKHQKKIKGIKVIIL